mgnify:CR=1 FL=1
METGSSITPVTTTENDDLSQPTPSDNPHNISPDQMGSETIRPHSTVTIPSNTIPLYSQNVNGIFDWEGTGLDKTFHAMRTIGENIFTLQETHGDKLNFNLNAKGTIHRSS